MFDVKPDRVGWTVYDVETGKPALLDDLLLTELEHETADELAGFPTATSTARARSA